MLERFQLPLPIWRVQYQLNGGHNRLLTFAGLYAAGILVAWSSLRALAAAGADDWLLRLLGVSQSGILLLAGINTANRSVNRERETRMIESHRISPLSNTSVPLGLVIGPNIHLLAAWLIGFAAGAYVTIKDGMGFQEWVGAHFLLLAAALTYWSMVVFLAIGAKKPTGVSAITLLLFLAIPLSLPAPGTGVVLATFPLYVGLGLLYNWTSFDAASTFGVGSVAALMMLYWLWVSAAKYRRPDLPAQNGFRGLVLLAIWLLASVPSVLLFKEIMKRVFAGNQVEEELVRAQWISMTLLAMLLALIPVWGATVCRNRRYEGAPPRNWTDRIGPYWVLLCACVMICAASVLGVHLASAGEQTFPAANQWFGLSPKITACLIICCSIVIGLYTLTRLVSALMNRFPGANTLLTLLIMIYLAAPLLTEFIILSIQQDSVDFGDFSSLPACTAPGAIIMVWCGDSAPIAAGLFAQAGLALVITLIPKSVRPKEPVFVAAPAVALAATATPVAPSSIGNPPPAPEIE